VILTNLAALKTTMKLLPFYILLITFFQSYSQQEERFQIEGQIIGLNEKPVADAHIINFRNMDRNFTHRNGVFSVWVLPGDSLNISHISYFRKVITVHSLLSNPIIKLELDTVNIQDVVVSPNQKTDYEKAKANLADVKEFDFPIYTKIDDESNPVLEMATQHNRVMRTEAGSISLFRFSPGQLINKIIKKKKRRLKSEE
jgi:hypothetical protein